MVEIRRPKKPYEAHRREFAAARGLETNQGDVEGAGAGSPAEAQGEASVAAPAPPAPPEAAPKPRRAGLPQEEKLRLKFAVHAPIPGTSAWFDRAVATMGDEKALRLVLAKAFDELEAAVAAGEAVARGSYPIDPSRSASTSRHVSAALFASGKGALDPMELLPPGTFGRELAMSALARLLRRAA
ncbi:VirC2 family conjugal transfer protein [Amaricoccus sp.]|uniref:VirC2 family conjugal transfer protein n=1 Tax=Amaricoccus sp. TaxID=1872485 RepID=UPI0026225683|nr:VirC2 family conjugal transfer protein [uncultured Amaricoccus sp.]